MITILLTIAALWISAAAGRALVDRLTILDDYHALERFVYSAALGLGIAAYGIYGLGLCGLLAFWPVTFWWAILSVAGLQGSRRHARDILAWFDKAWSHRHKSQPGEAKETSGARETMSHSARRIVDACCALLVIFGVIALAACFRPPGPQEWDVLSYHLADPRLFLIAHRIQTLATEHHSNFPFTLEMLYAAGLLYDGFALANMFHLVMTLLTVTALIGFGRRMDCVPAGWLAGVTYLTTPIVLWEASTAYIDNGLALYVTLATFAVLNAVGKGGNSLHPDASAPDSSRAWLLMGGAMMGFGLGIKYLALVPVVLLGLLLVIQRTPMKRTMLYVAVALVIGSPWYIKNALIMRNPVYPFAYSVFPHSRYWSEERAAGYQSEQNKFGTKPISTDAHSKLLNLALVPWDLLIQHPDQAGRPALLYCNPGEFTFTALYGGLYAALLFPIAFARRVPAGVRLLIWLALAQIGVWFLLSQVGRYLIQIMPIMAAAGAVVAARQAFGAGLNKQASDLALSDIVPQPEMQSVPHDVIKSDKRRRASYPAVQSLSGWLGIAAIFGQAGYVLLSICTLPTNAPVDDMLALMQLGQLPSSVSVPDLAANTGRRGKWEDDLRRHFDAYSTMQWINANTSKEAGVALYEETRGFYLDRPYLWANQQHSSYIPYETLRDGQELSAWMLAHGCRYALINLNAAAQNHLVDARGARLIDPVVPFGPNHYEAQALEEWYAHSVGGDRGHQLVGDAVRRGLWSPVFQEHGCIVLQIR